MGGFLSAEEKGHNSEPPMMAEEKGQNFESPVMAIQQARDLIAKFDRELFEGELNHVASARNVKLVWQTAIAGPYGNGQGMWENNLPIRRRKRVDGVQCDQEVKTCDKILDEMFIKLGSNVPTLLAVYLHTSHEPIGQKDQVLYFNTLPVPAEFEISKKTMIAENHGQESKDEIIKFDFKLFRKQMNSAASARKLQLIWQTESTGPNGNGNESWHNNLLIRKNKNVNSVAFDEELKTADEILNEMQRASNVTTNSPWLFAVYLRTSHDAQILYFNTLQFSSDSYSSIHTNETKQSTPFNDEQFIEDLRLVAQKADVTLTMVTKTPEDGWEYNVPVYERFASNVFTEMMIPCDSTRFIVAILRTEERAQCTDPAFKLLYYNFVKM